METTEPVAAKTTNGGPPPWLSRIARGVIAVSIVGIAVEAGIITYNRFSTAEPADTAYVMSLPGPLPLGTTLAGIVTRDHREESGPFERRLQEEPTIVLVFDTTCPVCQQTIPAWNDFYAQVTADGGEGRRVTGLSLHPPGLTSDFVSSYGVEFPVDAVIDRHALDAQVRPVYVPQTLVVDAGGAVLGAWIGPFDHEIAAKVLAATAPVPAGR